MLYVTLRVNSGEQSSRVYSGAKPVGPIQDRVHPHERRPVRRARGELLLTNLQVFFFHTAITITCHEPGPQNVAEWHEPVY